MKKFAIFTEFKGIDKISKPLSRMQSRVMKFTRAASRMTKKITAGAKKFGRGMWDATKWAAGGFTALTAAALTYITSINQATTETALLSEALGLSASKAEALSSILKPAGLNVENLTDLMEELNNKIGESKGLEQITPVTESLKILGLRFNDLKKLSPEKQFEAVADAAMKMKDSQQAASAVDILMGGEANKIISILRQRGGTLAEIIEKQQQLNFLTDRGRKGALDYSKSWADISLIFTSLNKELAGLLGEMLSPFIESLKEWVQANKELIGTKINEFVEKIRKGFEWIKENREQIVKWAKWIGIAVVAVGALVTAIIAIGTAVTAIIAILPGLVIALKVMLVGAAIWAVAKITEAFSLIGEIIFYNIKSAIMGVKNLWLEFTIWLSNAVDTALSKIGDLWEKIKGFGGGIFKTVFNAIVPTPLTAGANPVDTPAKRTADLIETRVSNSAEVTIRDESGRAEVTKGGDFPGFSFAPSGGF